MPMRMDFSDSFEDNIQRSFMVSCLPRCRLGIGIVRPACWCAGGVGRRAQREYCALVFAVSGPELGVSAFWACSCSLATEISPPSPAVPATFMQLLKRRELAKPGDLVVVVSDIRLPGSPAGVPEPHQVRSVQVRHVT